MYNLLTEPLVRMIKSGGDALNDASLLEVYTALMDDQVEAFPALRPHQRHAWHAFLVQLGAMAMHRAGLSEPPVDAREWCRIIRALTESEYPDDEPWHLVVDDITKPAFMQPPARSKEREKDYKNAVATPDELDMLVTSKNHDLKTAVATQAIVDDWIFALITLQTMEGFGGAGNYGISRMNGGLGNRPAFSLAPSGGGLGTQIRRDIIALLQFRPEILDKYQHYPDTGGLTLLWTLPWDGTTIETRPVNGLDPLYVEVCRRIRLRSGPDGRLYGLRTSSKAARIEAKSLNGLTGDPWAPVDHRDKKGDKVLTLPSGGFTYKRVTEYLTSGDYDRPLLLSPTQAEARSSEMMRLIARAMVRGQGKTEGYHERDFPVRHRLKSAMLRRDGSDLGDVGAIAQGRIGDIGKVQRILSHAIQTFAARGDPDNISPEHRNLARPWLNRLDEIVDATFFGALQDELEAVESQRQDIRRRWLLHDEDKSGVINHARVLLGDATDTLPCPTIYYYKARVNAEGLFEGRLRGNGGLPDLFREGHEEAEV